MANVSAGIFSKIQDLSTYVQQVPSTIGFVCVLTEKGEDNNLKDMGGRSELLSEYGEPNLLTFGKYYGQGMYIANNFIGQSGALKILRCLPADASLANVHLRYIETGATPTMSATYISSLTVDTISANLVDDSTSEDIGIFYPIGRGDHYNNLSINLTRVSNPLDFDSYILDIYEKQEITDVFEIIESFEVSFNKQSLASDGGTLFIEDILETYSNVLRFKIGDIADNYNNFFHIYDKNIGTVSVNDSTAVEYFITDTYQDFTPWSTDSGDATFVVIAKDVYGNTIGGYLYGLNDSEITSCNVTRDEAGTNGGWLYWTGTAWATGIGSFDDSTEIIYQVRKSLSGYGIAEFAFANGPVPLRGGSLGSLLDSVGDLNTTIADQVLTQGYNGTIDADVLDTENEYFSLSWDGGYTQNVKTAISALAQTREDCISVIDNLDQATYATERSNRNTLNTSNTFYTSIFGNYSKVYDAFTGRDLWVSPLYHMSYIIPRNDRVSELWNAPAGFNRAAIEGVKELRYNPTLTQRDQLYLDRVNPIVKFAAGYTMWSQLTSQRKASALTDINIVRLLLYVKKLLEQYTQFFVYEWNDEITWSQVSQDVNGALADIKKRRGLYSYNVEVSATEYEVKRKQFHVNVELFPTRTTEQILLNFFIK